MYEGLDKDTVKMFGALQYIGRAWSKLNNGNIRTLALRYPPHARFKLTSSLKGLGWAVAVSPWVWWNELSGTVERYSPLTAKPIPGVLY